MNIRQTKITPIESVCELLVIHSQQMQYGSVDVMNHHAIFDRLVANFISCPVVHPTLDSTAGKPHRHRMRIVIATDGLTRFTLGIRCSTKLTATNN